MRHGGWSQDLSILSDVRGGGGVGEGGAHLEAGDAAGLAEIGGAVEDGGGDAHKGVLHLAAVREAQRVGHHRPSQPRAREAGVLAEAAGLQRALLRACASVTRKKREAQSVKRMRFSAAARGALIPITELPPPRYPPRRELQLWMDCLRS